MPDMVMLTALLPVYFSCDTEGQVPNEGGSNAMITLQGSLTG